MSEEKKHDELEDLLPGTAYKLESGREVMVVPASFGDIRRFTDTVTSLAVKASTVEGIDLNNTESLVVLAEVAAEEVLVIMGLILGKEEKWFKGITIGDGIGLFTLIIEQNWTESTRKNVERLVAVVKKSALQTSAKS